MIDEKLIVAQNSTLLVSLSLQMISDAPQKWPQRTGTSPRHKMKNRVKRGLVSTSERFFLELTAVGGNHVQSCLMMAMDQLFFLPLPLN